MKVGDRITLFLEEKTGRKAKDGVEGEVVYLVKVQDTLNMNWLGRVRPKSAC